MKNIIFIAPPAAGKGTQSKLISAEYNIPHISTGDLLRDEIASGSPLGNFIKQDMEAGNLITDDVMIKLLRQRITQVDCNDGYILDGYPRTLEQAKIYDNLIQELRKDIGIVINLDIDKNLALKRTLSRMVCSACGSSYNKDVPALAPKIEGVCDKCGHQLKVRSDDVEETFLHRFDTFLEQTKPLTEYYNQRGILKTIKIDSVDSTTDVFNKIKQIMDTFSNDKV